ncbi:ECF RNA polymerase sigma factor SigW [bioreactor metagenome]|jgi:RNA polymerase sigma-70 factor (ECF subfamily)|uniref:ECF RNA polymerase sigma factor SigW n=1 Tax=bioreactor metagenome TaxID=1076179 RepID=A0A644T9E1_9ZZZZ|nr:sigma-70 family RNA polymerase sigma factor [Lentimicrobium sp.]MEA5109306.1 sigma-70 family RNA polymerase sigma factor [Lentimicrobium sp.]
MVEKRTPGEASIRDYQLVVQAISGDQKAYAELMALYEDLVYHALLKRVGDPMVAEDLTIETFGKAFRNLHRFSPDFAFSTWLFRIAINHSIDFQRKQKKDPCQREKGNIQISPPEVVDDTPDPEENYIREQRLNLMRETVEKLKPRYRRLIELRYFDELSYEEIAAEQNLPIGTVKAQLFRAKDLLFQILSGSREL